MYKVFIKKIKILTSQILNINMNDCKIDILNIIPLTIGNLLEIKIHCLNKNINLENTLKLIDELKKLERFTIKNIKLNNFEIKGDLYEF